MKVNERSGTQSPLTTVYITTMEEYYKDTVIKRLMNQYSLSHQYGYVH